MLAALAQDQEQMLDELSRKVAELYLACCPAAPHGEMEAQSTAEMLTSVMEKLNGMLETLEKAEPGMLKAAREALVKERGRMKRVRAPRR